MTSRLFALALAIVLAATVLARQPAANAIVAADGSGNYKTVQEAIDAVPQNTSASNRWTIVVKAGTYRERVYVQREKRFVRLVGEDAAGTVITFDLNATMPGPDGKPIGTFRTPTMTIDADDFTVENLTLENSAGPVGQALAAARGRRPCRLSQLPVHRLAGHDLPESRATVFRRLVHHWPRGLHLRRCDRVLRALSSPLPAQRLHHRGVDTARTAPRIRVRRWTDHRRGECPDLPRSSVA
jgi:hypothetical protein